MPTELSETGSFSIFVLGGAGAVGAEFCRAVLRADDLARLTVGDFDLDRARALSDELQDARVHVVAVDVRDVVATARAVAGHDLMMNTLFWEHFDDALTVACLAKADYADLLSMPSETHREQVSRAGITAVSGLGASPGVGNVLGRLACTTFDAPLSLEIACTSFRPIAPSLGLLDTLVELASPGLEGRGYHHLGRFVTTEPMEGSKLVDFGPPVGPVMVYYINHSEAWTFPRHFPSLQYVAVRGSYRPGLVEDMRILGRYGLLDAREVSVSDQRTTVRKFTRDRIAESALGREDPDSQHLFLHVEATGHRGGRWGRSTYRAAHPLSWRGAAIPRMTGIGAAIGALMIGRQRGSIGGMRDPEEYFEPEAFLAELRAFPGISVSSETHWE